MHSPGRFTPRAARRNGRLHIAVAAIATALALAACRSNESGSGGQPFETRASPLAAVPATASAIVAALRARPGSPVPAGVAQSFDAVASGLRPQFAASATAAEPAPARVTLPQLETAPIHLEDAQTGTAVDVSLRGALPAAAQTSDGYVVYPGALASGATVLERALPSGTEDFVNFDTRPATPAIAYDVALGPGVSGLRLVAGTLEMLDAGGAPRLRVSPPYVVGADGARTDAVLAVAGCAIDTSPAAPWGRPVTAPGAKTCTVNVTWPDQAVVYPAVLDPRWTTTGSMGTARQDHTMTLLATGKALVTGGRSSTGTTGLATAELYDKASGTWAATGSMTGGRFLHRATQLNTSSNTTTSGKVLISGGLNGTTSLNTAQLYSPTAGTWIAAGNLNAVRHGHTATLLADGRVLASGGLNGTATLATAAIYTPGTSGAGTWAATTGPLPPTGQKNHTAVLLVTSNQQLNNKVLLVGGNSGTATMAAVYLFDPAQSAFSTLASIPTPRELHTMTVLADGKVLVTGGKNGSTTLNTAIVFDPGFGPGSWSSAGTMTVARFGHTATLLPASIVANGQVLVAGGSSGSSTLSSVELLSGTSTWTATPAMPAPAQGHTAILLGNNMVLVAGGLNGTTVLSAARLYDASFGLGCSSNSQCASGFCANGICCDTACNSGTCSACNLAGHLGTCTPLANGTVCRASAGPCDVAETCNGTAVTCPSDGVAPLGTVCRSAPGACDVPETCDGTTKACPADGFAPSTTLCRASTGTCDAAENCTGTSASCPADGVAPATTVCRPATGGCDVAETCTGTSMICPPDTLAGAGTVCRAAVSLCDVTETCSGSSAACPGDAFASAGTTCGAGTPAPVCSGSTGTCPVASVASDVLGFEVSANWAFDPSATASIVGLSSNRMQGASSLEVTAQGSARLNSAAVNSIGSVGAMMLLDILLPTEQANPSNYGTAQMLINSPSLGISNLSLGAVTLTGLALGTWQTLAYPIPAATRSTLSSGVYSDLTFAIVLNVATNQTGHYRLDNIRSSADVVPSLLGVAKYGTTVKAVFDYLTTASVPVNIPYGTANGLSNPSGFIASPPEVPPTTFLPSTHAPFVATVSAASLTWTVGGHTATATPGSAPLPVTTLPDGTHDATLPDGRKVNVDAVPPPSPAGAAGPPVGAPYNGLVPGQLAISPSGAATYAVPISVPPGIGGMSPNLSLGYNSQGGNGIAGQGWNLGGLSAITRCPRTRQQDGYGRPVMLDSLVPSDNLDGKSDGICLDGKKLFELPPEGSGNYTSESQDFAAITRTGTQFQVVTKAGETRYYGRLNASKVAGAMWLLDRVVDQWGNFFDLHYNNDEGNGSPGFPNSFTASGIWLNRIDYTGTQTNPACNVAAPPASCFFATVTFEYECRPDIRWMRIRDLKIPQSQRLKSITTTQGKYSLTYTSPVTPLIGFSACPVGAGPSAIDVSKLASIGYCAGSQCAKPLVFTWDPALLFADWQPNSAYRLPSFVGGGRGLKGAQFVDLNGDGRSDFVLARTNGNQGQNQPQVASVLNTGTGWGPQLTGSGKTFPLYLSDANDNPTGVRFADMDGDGRIDVLADSANVSCSTGECLSCPIGQATCGADTTPYGPAVWLNRFTLDGGGGWQFAPDYSGVSVSFTGQSATMIADVDGDGKADFIRAFQPAQVPKPPQSGFNTVTVTLNTIVNGVHAWTTQSHNINVFFTDPNESPWTLKDVNRDGLPDLVKDKFFSYTDGSVQANETVMINQGPDAAANNDFRFSDPAVHNAAGGGSGLDPTDVRLADVDGDGFHDAVVYEPNNGQGVGYVVGVGFGDGTGSGFGDESAQYDTTFRAFSPLVGQDIDSARDQDYAYALVDIDGDGMVDLVRNHWNRSANSGSVQPGVGGGEILLNTGRKWLSVGGHTGWLLSAGQGKIPASIPSEVTAQAGSAFVDLDGDGLVDIVQEEEADTNLPPGAWTNPNKRPVIKFFPNALAAFATEVSYVTTTSTAASSTYADDDTTTENNVKALALPVSLVSQVQATDASGTGTTNTTTYKYHSLRQDEFGRGPLGFHRVESFDQASQTRTVTTFAQQYPYTGMATQVEKYQVVGSQSHLTQNTTTTYCDTLAANPSPPLGCGPAPAGKFPPGTIVSPRPDTVTDVAYLHPETDDLVNRTTTVTSFQFDTLANPTLTTTAMGKTEGGAIETYTKQTQNFYEITQAANEGHPTRTVTTSTGGTGSVTHTTTYAYLPASNFGGVSSRLVLSTTRVEPDAGWPTRVDTAVAYDQFGHTTTATTCASDFDSCAPGATNPLGTDATNPFDPSDPVHHPQFRTTTVSYDTSLLGTQVSYGSGRFPTVSTNALGQPEKTIYDPIFGKVVRTTAPNGVQTCYAYDGFARLTSGTARCNSTAPLTTTTQYFLTPGAPGFRPPNSFTVEVTTGPEGTPAWSYLDFQGKATGSLAYAFDGGFIETTKSYNALGQSTQVSKPFHIATVDEQVTPSYTTTTFDEFNRVKTIVDPLGVIDGSGTPKSTTITTTFSGSTIQTTRTVNGQTQVRSETKNAIGKVASVTTQTETGPSTISYFYDADGNLTITQDPVGNQVQTTYDSRGRKTAMIDPDMGSWSYTPNGFNDMAIQTDAKQQTTMMIYDRLARIRTMTDATGTAEWVYDSASGAGIGKVAAMVSAPNANLGLCGIPQGFTVTGAQRSVVSYRYTEFADIEQVNECADGTLFTTTYQYDALGRNSLVRYPVVGSSQLAVGYHYSSLGHLHYLTDDSTDYSLLWQAKAMNAIGQVTDEQMGNGVETVSNRNPLTGWLMGSTATAHADNNTVIQNWSYRFDEIGNLRSRARTDAASGAPSTETFGYDLTNRLTSSQLTGSSSIERYAYDLIGNLTQKGNKPYTYGVGCQGPAGPHAVCTVSGGTGFTYDGNGNLTNNGSRSVTYNPSNKVTHIESTPLMSQGNDTGSAEFAYGADGNRVLQLNTTGGVTSKTVYVGLGATGKSVYERTTKPGAPTKHVHFIYAQSVHAGNAFALRVLEDSGAVTSNKYASFDHLGSVTAMSDERGRVLASGSNPTVFGYDAWGARRNPDGTAANPASFNPPEGNRQFTGQEQIPNVGLVNMNGRLYDPSLGLFLSPDPNIQLVTDLQSYNRYSYSGNNPLRYTDPTGYFWSEIGTFFKSYFSDPANIFVFVSSIAVCAVSYGVGCAVWGLEIAAMQITIAVSNGAGFKETILAAGIGLGIGILTAGVLNYAEVSPLIGIIVGATAAAVTTGISNVIDGQDFWQINILGAALLSAAQGALTIGLRQLIPVSNAALRVVEKRFGPDGEEKAIAHLVSRKIDLRPLSFWDKVGCWIVGASHSGWIIESPDGPVYLVDSGMTAAEPGRQYGTAMANNVRQYTSLDAALSAFAGGQEGQYVKVYEVGVYSMDSMSKADYQSICRQYNDMNMPYDPLTYNSNGFAHWFGNQTNVEMPIGTFPPVSGMFRDYLHGWDSLPK